MLHAPTSPSNPPSSLEQNSNNSLYLSAKTDELKELVRLFASPGLTGRVLRTLAYYTQHPQPPQRPEDIEILLTVSTALRLAFGSKER